MTPTREFPNPGPIMQYLLNELVARSISWMLTGACKYPTRRRQVGELVLRYLIAAAPQGA